MPDDSKKIVYLGFGGNLGDVLNTIKNAIRLLKEHSEVFDLHHSHFYHSSPVDMLSKNIFVNAVCRFNTTLSLRELYSFVEQVEQQLGKVKKAKNACRPIDIDIIFYHSSVYNDGELQIPHPEWKNRLFVLKPLFDLTDHVFIHDQKGSQIVKIEPLLEQFLNQSAQSISLLEENLDIQ